MKNLLFALLAVCTVAFVGCGDDEPACEFELAGTYVGTESTAGVESDATIIISGTDGDYSISGGSLVADNLDQDGCNFSYEVGAFGVGGSVDGSFDGTTLEWERFVGGVSTTTFTGTKQ